MIDQNELLALGVALTRTVREKIEYSTNIDSLFDKRNPSKYHKRLDYGLEFIRNREGYSDISYMNKAELAFKSKSGNCGELSACVMLLAASFPELFVGENVYVSLLYLSSNHALVLLHQSSDLYFSHERLGSLAELTMNGELDNAVLIDPWIYKACKVNETKSLFDKAREYGVIDNYIGSIDLNFKENKTIVSCLRNEDFWREFTFIKDRCSSIFDEQVSKFQNGRESFAKSRSFYDVQASLYNRVEGEHIVRETEIESMITFFKRILHNASHWYSKNSLKHKLIRKLVLSLQSCIKEQYSINLLDLRILFKSALRILPVV